MKRTLLVATLVALTLSGCARVFPGSWRHAATSKQPPAHVATKTTNPAPTKSPAPAAAKTPATHKS